MSVPIDDNNGLCCCEYVNGEGEQSHLLASFCNCEALDLICDRCLRLQTIDRGLWGQLQLTVLDRLRIPWPGGARKLNLSVLFPFIFVPFVILFGSVSLAASIISYIIIFPSLIYIITRRIREKWKAQLPLTSQSNNRSLRTQFYPALLVSSVLWLYYFFIFFIIYPIKINGLEAFILSSLFHSSFSCFYICKKKAAKGFDPPPECEVDLIDESWKVCSDCDEQVPALASHCRACGTCYVLKDHHCLWLDCCISITNDRMFLSGSFLCATALWYASHLAITTVCTPRYLIYTENFSLMVPRDCTYAYASWTSGVCTSTACFLVLLSVCVTCLTVLQLLSVASGARGPKGALRKRPILDPTMVPLHCFDFWCTKRIPKTHSNNH